MAQNISNVKAREEKLILLHIDSLAREFDAAKLLKSKLQHMGFRVVLSSRRSTYYLTKWFTPSATILTHTFSLPNEIKNKLQSQGGKVLLNVVEEVMGDETYMNIFYRSDVQPELFDSIFVWSKWAKNWLNERINISKDKVHAVGSIRNSLLATPRCSKPTSSKIGILGRFEGINTWDKRHPFNDLVNMDPHFKDVDTRFYMEKKAIDCEGFCIAVKAIEKLISAGYEIVFRPHPNEDISSYQILREKFGTKLIINNDTSLLDFLNSVKCICGPSSSAFTEAYLMKVPIISFSDLQIHRYSDPEVYESLDFMDLGAHKPQTIDELTNLCMDDSLEPVSSKKLDNYLNDFYSLNNEDNAADAITHSIFLQKDQMRRFGISKYILFILARFLIDMGCLVQAATLRRGTAPMSVLNRYHYNSILH